MGRAIARPITSFIAVATIQESGELLSLAGGGREGVESLPIGNPDPLS